MLTQRQLTFLIGCIGTRLAFSYIASIADGIWKHLFGTVLMAIGVGFLVIYFGGLRKTGFEAGGKIWWDWLRPFHGLMYLTAGIALCMYDQNRVASQIIFADTIIGLLAFLHHHFM